MPVRSLSSSVLKWPNAETVDCAVRSWAKKIVQCREGVQRIGYFGSYARRDWGVGSDLDLIIIVRDSQRPFTRRRVDWHTTELPVPADILVYTEAEWRSLTRQGKFARTIAKEAVWIFVHKKASNS